MNIFTRNKKLPQHTEITNFDHAKIFSAIRAAEPNFLIFGNRGEFYAIGITETSDCPPSSTPEKALISYWKKHKTLLTRRGLIFRWDIIKECYVDQNSNAPTSAIDITWQDNLDSLKGEKQIPGIARRMQAIQEVSDELNKPLNHLLTDIISEN